MNWYTFLKLADIVEDKVNSVRTLSILIAEHDCPYKFAEAAMRAISNGDITLKSRGAANARELIALWYLIKTKQEERGEPDLLRAS